MNTPITFLVRNKLLILLCAALLLGLPVNALASPPRDPSANSSLYLPYVITPPQSSSNVIVCGQPFQGQFLNGEKNLLTFNGIAGDYINIAGDRRPSATWQLSLLDPNGTLLASMTSQAADPQLLNIQLAQTGVYSIEADGLGAAIGNYTVALYCAASRTTWETDTLVFGSAFKGNFPTAGSERLFIFAAASGDYITLKGDQRPNGVWKIRLIDPLGRQVAEVNSQSGEPVMMNKLLGTTGTYLVVTDGVDLTTGDFTLSLYGPPEKWAVPEIPITYGQTIFGEFLQPGDEFSYYFPAQQGDRIRIDGQQMVNGVYQVWLIDPRGFVLEVRSSQLGPIAFALNLTRDGIHRIVADGIDYYDPASQMVVTSLGVYEFKLTQR